MSDEMYAEKFGVVIILDALGASFFTRDQIRTFLSARANVNKIVKGFHSRFTKKFAEEITVAKPVIFTFGDTLVMTLEIDQKQEVAAQIGNAIFLMRRYMFHSLCHGVLFRGAFSIGNFIEDAASNTVMGEAVADAAEWYERADWAGVCATPRACTQMDYYYAGQTLSPMFMVPYDVPLKGGSTQRLFSISWPGGFFDINQKQKISQEPTPELAFLALLKEMSYPASAASKYENTKAFFSFVSKAIEQHKSEALKKQPSK